MYKAYRREPRILREQRCNFQDDVSYEVCLAALTHESNLTGSKQRPFYYRSRIAVVGSALNLRLYDEAIRYYRESLDLVPSSWALRDNLASALIQQGKPGDALGLLQKSLEITKGADASINTLVLRGRAYLDLGRHLEAIDDLNQALVLDSSYAQAHAIRALAYTNLGQDVQASDDASRVAELDANPTELNRAIDQKNAIGRVCANIAEFATRRSELRIQLHQVFSAAMPPPRSTASRLAFGPFTLHFTATPIGNFRPGALLNRSPEIPSPIQTAHFSIWLASVPAGSPP